MRFTTLALGVLGLAGFAVGEAEPTLTRTIKSHIVYDPSTRTVELTPLFHLEAPAVTDFHVGEVASSSVEEISLTLPMTSTCNEGSMTLEQLQQTDVCTEPKSHSYENRPCASSFYKYYVCMTTATSSTESNDFGGTRSPRWVAQFARATPAVAALIEALPAAAREARFYAKFAARATQGLDEAAGREARLDAKFAARAAREAHHIPKFGPSPTITPVPHARQITPPPFPICSFNLDKGEYVCPEKAKRQALPLCSFDLDKGEYVCPPLLCTFDLSKGEYVCPKAPRTAIPEEIGVIEVVATTLKTVIKV